jgi:transcriptional regulator with XRE-family HTH domain
MKLTPLQKVQFGSWLRFLRRQARLSQKAVAERTGIDWKRYQKYEYGEFFPRPDNRQLLAEALGVTVEHLLLGLVVAGANDAPVERSGERHCRCYTLSRTVALGRPELASLVGWMEEEDVDVITVVNGGPELNVMLACHNSAHTARHPAVPSAATAPAPSP